MKFVKKYIVGVSISNDIKVYYKKSNQETEDADFTLSCSKAKHFDDKFVANAVAQSLGECGYETSVDDILSIQFEEHILSSPINEVDNDTTEIGDIVGKDFVNAHYMVLSDSGYVYDEGDIVTTLSLAEDFLECCNEVEEVDYIDSIHRLLRNNKGEQLIRLICEAWDGLKLKKID